MNVKLKFAFGDIVYHTMSHCQSPLLFDSLAITSAVPVEGIRCSSQFESGTGCGTNTGNLNNCLAQGYGDSSTILRYTSSAISWSALAVASSSARSV